MAKNQGGNLEEVSGSEWETVSEESGSPILFDSVGAQFVGTFTGKRVIEPTDNPDDSFTQLTFRDTDENVRTINAGYKLLEAFADIAEGSKIRITRTPDVPMNDPKKNDMKDYRVEVARS